MKKIIIKLIEAYQKTLSPDNGWFSYMHPNGFCRFYPNCSEYSRQSIEKFGLFKGGFKALLRIIRCNPLSKGGVDKIK